MELVNRSLKHLNRYRIIVAIGFLVVVVLVLVFPVKMFGNSPWAYYHGVENFANGALVIDDSVHAKQQADANSQGGHLTQYDEIGDDRWALEKAPGYVSYLVPFQ